MNLLIWIWEKICDLIDYLTLDLVTEKSWVKKDVPAPEASAGPSAPLDNHGCYVEPENVRIQREAYVNRRKDDRSKRAIRELMQSVGRN